MNESDKDFDLFLTEEGVQALYYAVNEALRLWPGAPARPAEEQETLYGLKLAIFAMKMELVMEKPNEGEA